MLTYRLCCSHIVVHPDMALEPFPCDSRNPEAYFQRPFQAKTLKGLEDMERMLKKGEFVPFFYLASLSLLRRVGDGLLFVLPRSISTSQSDRNNFLCRHIFPRL